METELKDVLHLYIGCEVQTNYKRHTSSGLPLKKLKGTLQEYDLYMPDKCGVLLEDTSDKTHYSTFDIKTIKPLLRPLSDINFEEMKYIFKLPENSTFIKKNQYNKGVSIEYRWISEKVNNDDGYSYSEVGISTNKAVFTSSHFIFLLKNKIDLFGLIESKQAVDKTQL